MNKILAGLYVPAVEAHFDLLVPLDTDIATLTGLISDGARELCAGYYKPSQIVTLSTRNPDILLNPEKTLRDYNVDNGVRLVLI